MEKLQERYMRWVLKVDGRIPGYMIREEGKREKMRLGSRAVRYKKKLEKGEVVNGRANAGRRLRRKGKIASRDGRNKKSAFIE